MTRTKFHKFVNLSNPQGALIVKNQTCEIVFLLHAHRK